MSARNAPVTTPRKTLANMLAVLGRERLAWVLSSFYFLTFGGFVAFSIYLPVLLRQEFGLKATDAGLRAAGFVLLATGMLPLGGWLADRMGGAPVLSVVFFGAAPCGLAATVRPAFPGDGTQILAEILQSRPAEEPVPRRSEFRRGDVPSGPCIRRYQDLFGRSVPRLKGMASVPTLHCDIHWSR